MLTETASTATSKTYNAVIAFDVAIDDVIAVTDSIDATVTATGTIKISGSVTVDTASLYQSWAIANGIPGALFGDDHNGDGVSNGILWALGLDAADDPASNLPAVSGNTMTFTLPLGGSAGDLFLEGSDTLKPGE